MAYGNVLVFRALVFRLLFHRKSVFLAGYGTLKFASKVGFSTSTSRSSTQLVINTPFRNTLFVLVRRMDTLNRCLKFGNWEFNEENFEIDTKYELRYFVFCGDENMKTKQVARNKERKYEAKHM